MADPWKGILEPDEKILWQGAPSGQVKNEWESASSPLVFAAIMVFPMLGMIQSGEYAGYLWVVGIFFMGFGLYGLIGVHFWKAFLRRHQFYTLTDRRAFIGKSLHGTRKLRSYPITPETEFELNDFQRSGDIYFAKDVRQGEDGPIITKIGFEQIEDPRQVLALFREVQKNA